MKKVIVMLAAVLAIGAASAQENEAGKRISQCRIKTLAVLALGAMQLAGCGKDNDVLIGKWSNTSQSYEITIGGQEYLPKGCICMEFTDSKVLISDSRTDCLAEWHNYTLSKESGKQLLEIEGGCYNGMVFVVEKLTSYELVLVPKHHEIDMDFRYIMKRD